MGVQKGFRTDLKIHPSKIGPERRLEIQDGITDGGTFLPNQVLVEDMDEAFIEFVKTDLSITIDGEKVPVNFFTIQRWMEFTKTWESSDKYKNMKVPFITIVRNPDIQEGTNQAGLWNIPGKRTYTYMKVPTNDGARTGMDTYKVPQPTAVDITYEVRLFTNRMKDLNTLTEVVRTAFQSRQYYINVNGHPMPIHSESTGDESNIDDFENRRYYIISYEMLLKGYILMAKDFEIIPTINRAVAAIEVSESKLPTTLTFDPVVRENEITYSFVFKPNSISQFSFNAPYDMTMTQLINVEYLNRIVIQADEVTVFDGLVLTSPLVFDANSTITIRVYKTTNVRVGKFQLIGNII